jgi:hypothetical protein
VIFLEPHWLSTCNFIGSKEVLILILSCEVATKPNDWKFLSKTPDLQTTTMFVPQKVLEVSNFVAWYQRNLEHAQDFFDIQRFNY